MAFHPSRARHSSLALTLCLLASTACADATTHPAGVPEPDRQVLVLDGGSGRSYSLSRSPVQLGTSVIATAPRRNSATLASDDPMTFDGFRRLPAEGGSNGWVSIPDGGDAFFRDVSVAIENTLTAVNDGDTWDVTVVHPNGLTESGGIITYRQELNGQQDCFVFGLSALCGSTQVFLTTFLNSQCAESGTWAVRFIYDGAAHGQASFRLHPRIPDRAVPQWFQLDYPTTWYDSACTKGHGSIKCTGAAGEVKRTIKQKGCGLTSATMALGYFGVPGSPSDVNDHMTANGGYQPGGNLLFPAFAGYAATIDTTVKITTRVGLTPAQLRGRICRFGPQILEVRSLSPHGTQHFVLAVGYDDDDATVRIHDPASTGRTTLTEYGTWRSARLVERPARQDTLAPGIVVTVHSPAQLTVTNPNGLRAGYDAARGTLLSEIPGADYDTVAALSTIADDGSFIDDEPDPPKELDIHMATAGDYVVDVTGTGTGTYLLTINGFGARGRSTAAQFNDVPISAGEVHRYQFTYDPSTAGQPGASLALSGAFSGGGQRRTVDELLSYARPGQRQTSLLAGTTAYSILIFYGAGVDPASFSADLAGTDVGTLFHPAPGSSETVTIPLASGRNVLTLSNRGRVGGRTTTDRDQLVFNVP